MIQQKTVVSIWFMLVIAHGLLAPSALAQITIQSAIYGSKQTKAVDMVGGGCYQRNPTILTNAVSSYCKDNTKGGVCDYTVPWPEPSQDPGLGCYKNFVASYRCAGYANSKTIEFGGLTEEAANQVAYFDCGPETIGTVTFTKDSDSQPFYSNGNQVSAGFSIKALDQYNAPYDGPITVGTRVSPASVWVQNLDRTKYYLNCNSAPTVSMKGDGTGGIYVTYQVTGYSNVIYTSGVGSSVSSASVTFILGVNGSSCSGAFDFFYNTHNEMQIEGDYFLVLNNTEVPLNISFQAPQNVTPSFVLTPDATSPLSSSRFLSSATSTSKVGSFRYNFFYRNQYGLPAGISVSCTIGTSAPFVLTTDSVTGRLQMTGTYAMTQAGRDTSSGNMQWNVTTSLTGSNPVFTLLTGRNIGSVVCTPADSSAAPYVQNLGTM